MKKIKIALINSSLLLLLTLGFISCDKDFASIGSSIIGNNNFDSESETFDVITYNQNVAPIQTNGLESNLLGFNSHPVFGDFTASIVTQLTAETYDPSFGENVVLDSVVLTIPYFSTNVETDADGNSTYELDSIFGNSPIKLSVFKNNYFLRDFDPNSEFGDAQIYYSDKTASDGSAINQTDLENVLLYENDAFEVDGEQIILTEIRLDENGDPVLDENDEPIVDVTARLSPSIRVKLDNPNDDFWQNLIFNKEGEPELSNENNFLNHFRGIYIKAEATNPDGTMMLINFGSNTNLTLFYTSEVDGGDDGGTDSENSTASGSFVLNVGGNKINFFENNFISIPDGDTVNGDERLYLKGGEGSMAVVNLFNGDDEGNSTAFEDFLNLYRKTDVNGDFVTGNNGQFLGNRLINQAHIEFFVDQTTMEGEEPDRVLLYDLNNNIPLIDYFLDQSVSNTQVNAKIDHLQPLVRVDDDPEGEGIKYRIEITEHMNNIVLRDSTNVKLGLVVTTNVNSVINFDLKDQSQIEEILSGQILSPRGTVVFGNNTADETKKVKLKIFYTEPNN